MSLTTWLGRGPALLEDTPPTGRRLRLDVAGADRRGPRPRVQRPLPWVPLDATWPISLGCAGLEAAVERLRGRGHERGRGRRRDPGHRRPPGRPGPGAGARRCSAVAAVHHELVRAGLRTRCSLVVDSGEPREVHHVACLIGYGADAVHPLAGGRRDRARARQGPAEGDVEDGRLDGLRPTAARSSSRRSGSGRS